MKRNILFSAIAVLIIATVCVMAQVAALKREVVFKVLPNVNLNASTIRITSGELWLNRRAVFNVELLNTNNVIVDRLAVTLIRSELRQWLNSTNAASTLKDLIVGKLTVLPDTTESVDETE